MTPPLGLWPASALLALFACAPEPGVDDRPAPEPPEAHTGDDDDDDVVGDDDDDTPHTGGVPPITDLERAAAATTTATTHPDCAESTLGPYYWEIGDAAGARASGQVGTDAPTATTVYSLASASKWVYAAYVLQKVGARAEDVTYLRFTSGYNGLVVPVCGVTETVEGCLGGRDTPIPGTVDQFLYGGGHMQQHAVASMGLGPLGIRDLSQEVRDTLATPGLGYSQPQLASGLVGSAADYAVFLRAVLRGDLSIAAELGTHAVCTNPTTCPTALGTPIPEVESWSYSLGHWVEDDPLYGDGAFSSAGALGFYPWIDQTKTLYGVLSRRTEDERNGGYNSAVCGRLLRQAWVSGVPIPSGPPSP